MNDGEANGLETLRLDIVEAIGEIDDPAFLQGVSDTLGEYLAQREPTAPRQLRAAGVLGGDARAHWRRCAACNNVAIHTSDISPGVLCHQCGSQDTRTILRPFDWNQH